MNTKKIQSSSRPPTVFDFADARQEWRHYERTCKHNGTRNNKFDHIQSFVTDIIQEEPRASALRCASVFQVMHNENSWTTFSSCSSITFCAITETFGILAERSGSNHVGQWKVQFEKNLNNLEHSGASDSTIKTCICSLLIGSQSSFGSLSDALKLKICESIATCFWLDPDLQTLVAPLLSTAPAARLKELPLTLSSPANEELVKNYMPEEHTFLDLCLSRSDWEDDKKIKTALMYILHKAPDQAASEQLTLPVNAFD